MADLIDASRKGDVGKLKTILKKGTVTNFRNKDNSTALHLASSNGKTQAVELLLAQDDINVNAVDSEGNSPLHLAAKGSHYDVAFALLRSGASSNISNSDGQKPVDVAKDPKLKALLAEKMVNVRNGNEGRFELITQIESELPNDVHSLKNFSIDLLYVYQLFQDRCKETIRQLIEEKHVALHKYRLLENAAGIKNQEQSGNFLAQLQYLQQENESQTATMAYLKLQNKMLEATVVQQEEYFRKNLAELSDQHAMEIKVINDRYTESEQNFFDVQKSLTEELVSYRNESFNKALKSEANNMPASDQAFIMDVQNENNALQHRLKALESENTALREKLRAVEQIKSMHEAELTKHRSDMNALRKAMLEAMNKVMNEAKNEADENDESSGQIEFVKGESGNKQVKAATAEKLVERVTDPRTFDSQFQASFLLTFRSFMDCSTLLKLLEKRFRESTDPDAGPSISNLQSSKSPLQLRICNLVKTWIENYWFDFQENKQLQKQLEDLIQIVKNADDKLAKIVSIVYEKKLNRLEDSPNDNMKKSRPIPPKPILPKVLAKRSLPAESASISLSSNNLFKPDRPMSLASWSMLNFGKKNSAEDKAFADLKLKLLDIDPLEMARQMTIVEHQLFMSIHPTEFMDQKWMKKDKETKAPNICRMTKWSNHVARWIVTEIISVTDNVKTRAAIFERFVQIAHQMERLNNFNGVKEILAGLQASAVHRLRKTREAVGPKYLKIFDDLVKLTSSDLNFKNLRAKIHASDPPLLPFPGVYQGDLVYLDTCSRNKTESGLINFMKYQKIAGYILELQVYQQTQYNFEFVPEIVHYIKTFQPLTDDEAYGESLICEPREN